MTDGPIDFLRPWALILLLLLLPTIALWRTSLLPLVPWRRVLTLGLRLLLFLVLIGALAGTRWIQRTDELCVVFVLDRSQSVPLKAQEGALAWIRQAARAMGPSDRAALIGFGAEAALEEPPDPRPALASPAGDVRTHRSDVARALRLALATFPEGTARRVVLLSDGNQTEGDALREAALLRAAEVRIDVLPLGSETSDREALIERVGVPPHVAPDEDVPLRVRILSRGGGEGTLRVRRNGSLLPDLPVRFGDGRSIVTYVDVIPEEQADGSSVIYEVTLETSDDALAANNTGFAITQLSGRPRILYLEQAAAVRDGLAEPLADTLRRAGFVVDIRTEADTPLNAEDLLPYRAILHGDVAADHFLPEQLEAIRRYVRDGGGGYLMMGGAETFGPGGYYRTPIEEALPVRMDVRHKKKLPSLAIVICVDKSGSMSSLVGGKQKIAIAREAAVKTMETLQPWDRFGLIGFDSAAKEIVPLSEARDRKRIATLARTLRAGGGTDMYPALDMAHGWLRETQAVFKHIIALTDGMCAPGDYEGLAARMLKEGITLSAVAVGPDADRRFLRDLARKGGGRFFHARSARNIPRIFAQATLMAYRSLVKEVPEGITPGVVTPGRLIEGLDAFPDIYGYVVTSPEPRAEIILQTPDEDADPILAAWAYGIGRAVAFTSDAKARWGRDWIRWGGYERLWTQIARHLLRQEEGLRFPTVIELSGGTGRLAVDAVDADGAFLDFLALEGVVGGPEGEPARFPLEQVGPGRYEGRFPAGEPGTYTAFVLRADGQGPPVGSAAANIPYPEEFRSIGPDHALLASLAETTDGRVLSEPLGVFRREGEPGRRPHEVWAFLVLLAAFALVAEIFARRFVLPDGLAKRLVRRRPAAAPTAGGALARLKAAKHTATAKTEGGEPIPPLVADGLTTPVGPEPPTQAPPPSPTPEEGTATDALARLKEARRRARRDM